MVNTIDICLLLLLTQFKSIISTNDRLNLTTDETPMFITITFDGVVDEDSYDHIDKLLENTNRNDEQIPLTFFINNDIEYMKNYTDFSVVQDIYLQGCEIAVVVGTHTTLWDTHINKWYYEIDQSRKLISDHAAIPIENIIGFRTNLFKNKQSDILNQLQSELQVLHGLNPPFLYDSSIINNNLNTIAIETNYSWPYKLDNYSIYAADVWEVSIYDLDAIINNTFKDKISYIFDEKYNGDRSPMNLRFNMSWLQLEENAYILNNFIEWVLEQDNTWFVTNKQLIEWTNNPIPNTEYNGPTITDNKLINDTTDFILCPYLEGNFTTAQNECPDKWPFRNEWDLNDMVYTQINITTNKHNINQDYIFCKTNDYEIYDSETEYCTDTTDKHKIIQYEDILYKCQWWTKKGELPGDSESDSTVWEKVKDCSDANDLFVRGNIVPYGLVNVFIENELHINIQPYNGYDIDFIDVIVDGVVYNLSIFDDYDLINDNELVIRFDDITIPKYEIQISFTSAADMVKTSIIAVFVMISVCATFVN
eukprot:230836_1